MKNSGEPRSHSGTISVCMFEQAVHGTCERIFKIRLANSRERERKCAKFNRKFNIRLMCPSSKSLTSARRELYRLDASQSEKHSYFMVSLLLLLSYKIYMYSMSYIPPLSQLVASYLSLKKVLRPFYKLKLSVQSKGNIYVV